MNNRARKSVTIDELDRSIGFLRAIGPIKSALMSLVDAAEAVRVLHDRRPAEGSIAADELASQSQIAGDWGDSPVADASTITWTLIGAAEGHITAFAELLTSEILSPYPLDVLARAAVENLARAMWLAEPALGRDKRVARAENERLFSARERAKLAPELRTEADALCDRIIDTARMHGFSVLSAKKGAPTRLVNRKGATALVGDLFLDTDGQGLGQFLYRLLSASTHGTMYGIVRHVHQVDTPSNDLGVITVGSHEIMLLGQAILLAYTTVMKSWFRYLGWTALGDWEKVSTNAYRALHPRS